MIDLEHVTKFYKNRGRRKLILDDVSFSMLSGTSYGIIGINGAGKSTTMRLLSGSELPNSGKIRRNVRVSWPLGFAGGLHPRLSGRENTHFIARLYGEDIRKVADFVEDFSELGSDFDLPTGLYSSGMMQRLAFGLSMAIEFECYLIDEVMAVGDARFQERCASEFQKRKNTSDVVIISHSMEMIREYCNKCLVLAHGVLHEFSDVSDAIELYKKLNQ
ncbi:capsular polysaccharide transport system ATP-binding protein [Rhodobacter sp. JA431]|uniref:ABC transporter ATP-binding protein n=1 Tax=Rhodobacter sp. JA431 TaxID=570013 RepID=UPI000BD3C9DF|nr:ABC transporter ATP-binding protein [Rhodobacter sp. JA431]SOC08261.1 capsular polysaccharide transport system ATP-binding protein [Rhodobacter sp. JA431]